MSARPPASSTPSAAREVVVRAFQEADVEDVVDLFQAPRCQMGTLQMPLQSRDAIRERLRDRRATRHSLVAAVGDPERVVGLVGLDHYVGRRAHVGGIGMFVHDDFQGRGIGGRLLAAAIDLADNWLRIERLELCVYVDNEPAIRLYERHGFVTEGVHRRYALRGGAYVDARFMARLKPGT